METIFVTVGTTKFEELITTVTDAATLEILHGIGCRNLIIQHGRGPKPTVTSYKEMTIQSFDFQPSIHEFMKNADLIISHAGSGSILESLWLKKRLVVAVNERLMHNHQVELAEKMQQLNHLFYGNCSYLPTILQTKDFAQLKPYRGEKNSKKFTDFLDKVMGFES